MAAQDGRVRVSVKFNYVSSSPEEDTMGGVAAMDIEEATAGSIANNKEGGTGVQAKLDQFRDFVSRSCCSCVAKMPAILLIISICLVVALLLALIPAVFILTNAVSSDTQALVSRGEDVNAIRTLYGLKADNESEEAVDLPVMIHGIPITALYPPNVSMSFGFGFACLTQPSFVISTSKRCDGTSDCPDGSDERDCPSCQSWASCQNSNNELVCLSGAQICDKINHCPNAYDEVQYCKSDCDEGQHQCKKTNGMSICLPKEAVCDGYEDCADGSDEDKCETCQNDSKFCSVGNFCIQARNVCDGVPDCDDDSDELGCDQRSCSGRGRAVCKTDGRCIDEMQICDGFPDCTDGADEVNCPGYCALEPESKERDEDIDGSGRSYCCKVDGTCHDISARCDGVAHCPDGQDEIDCTCNECIGSHKDVYMCGSGSRCLRREDVCSPYSNCPNATFADKAFCAIQHLRTPHDD